MSMNLHERLPGRGPSPGRLALVWMGAALLAGCAGWDEPADHGLAPRESAILYPREHLQSAEPWEREERDRQEALNAYRKNRDQKR